jgi:mono/diheme cytochrome c family protein
LKKILRPLTIAILCGAPIALAADTLPPGPARKTVARVCGTCHELNVVTDKKLDRVQWQDIVNEMIGFGAKLSKSQATDVVNYLARNFGNKDRGRELVEDVCTYCHGLDKLEGQERSKEEWRDLIKGMIFEGAPVTDEEFALIVDYLARNFGKKDP